MGLVTNARKARIFLKMDNSYGIKRELSMLRQGFFSKRQYFYPFDRFDKALFLTDWEIEFNFSKLNRREAREPLTNKVFFHLMLRQAGLGHKSSGLLGSVSEGRYRSFSEFQALDEIFESREKVFLKPVSGAGGRSCFIARSINEIPQDGTYVIENIAETHPYTLGIFPHSINTIRVFTLKDDNGEHFIAGAAHRFGGQADCPIDNFSRGGISCGIDLETGVLGAGFSSPGVYPKFFHTTHPLTNTPLAGTQIPYWKEAKNLALELASYFNDLNYAGWDIYVSPKGPMVIEGNGGIANPDLIQVHSPLLDKERVRNQLFRLGVISQERKECIDQLMSG